MRRAKDAMPVDIRRLLGLRGISVFSLAFNDTPPVSIPMNTQEEAGILLAQSVEGERFIDIGFASLNAQCKNVAVREAGCFWGIRFNRIVALDLHDGVFHSVSPAAVVVNVVDLLANHSAVGAAFFCEFVEGCGVAARP